MDDSRPAPANTGPFFRVFVALLQVVTWWVMYSDGRVDRTEALILARRMPVPWCVVVVNQVSVRLCHWFTALLCAVAGELRGG